MKIEKLNDDKIKITLSFDDLSERNIDVRSFIYNSPESQDLFWDAMQEAEEQYGFCIDESMIYVEASAQENENFTLIITKAPDSPAKHNIRSKIRNGHFRLKRKSSSSNFDNSIFSFDSFDDICDFSSVVDCSLIYSSSLFEMDGKYFLRVSNMPFNNIFEYSSIVKNSILFSAKLSEYGKLIIGDNALNTISKSFFKKRSRKRV